MTPKEKAFELYIQYYKNKKMAIDRARKEKESVYDTYYADDVKEFEYWDSVIKEIENL